MTVKQIADDLAKLGEFYDILDDAVLKKDTKMVEQLLQLFPDENLPNGVIMNSRLCFTNPSLIIFWLDWLFERNILPNDYAWSWCYDTECCVFPEHRVDLTIIKTWLDNHNIDGKELFDWIPQDVQN